MDAIVPIVDELEGVTRETGLSPYPVFRDWLDLMVHAFAGDDPAYLDVVDRYEDRHGEERARACVEAYSRALGELVVATADVNHEVLGSVYDHLGATSDSFGQHFTPHNVSDAVARLAFIPDDVQDIDPPLRLHDPACGSGRMLVSAAKILHEMHDAPTAIYTGQDKDPICAKMTALNLALARLPGRIVLGDSLTLEERKVWTVRPWESRPISVDVPSDSTEKTALEGTL